jgi:nitrogen regulatory protein P-II 1
MKRIEVIIPTERVNKLNDILKGFKVGGITYSNVMGRGRTVPSPAQSSRGTRAYTPEFQAWSSAVTVVRDEEVDNIVDAIIHLLSTGEARDGKIFVSNVEQAIDIGSGRKGESVI